MNSSKRKSLGFSLVEMITAVGIIGILLFLAIPNIVRVREDSELSLAIARAESLNMAMASFMQARGRQTAQSDWSGNDAAKYTLVQPYLQYAPTSLANFLPGYTIGFPGTLGNQQKVSLTPIGGTAISY